MGVKDEKLSSFWVSRKNPNFKGGGFTRKTVYIKDCLKREAWTVCRCKGGLGKKEGIGAFERGINTPMHNMTLLFVK